MTQQSAPDHGPYWWCLVHRCVEGDRGCGHKDRLGPYATRAQAQEALSAARDRSDAWDEADQRWEH